MVEGTSRAEPSSDVECVRRPILQQYPGKLSDIMPYATVSDLKCAMKRFVSYLTDA